MAHRAADSLAAPTPCIGRGGLWITGDTEAGAAQQHPAPAPAIPAPASLGATSGPPAQPLSPSLSSLHMRGGLGKTLLIAFLLLAIVPLSFLALVTYHQVQRDIQQRLLASLGTVAAFQEAHLVDWVEASRRDLALVATALERTSLAPGGDPAAAQAELEAQLAALRPAYSSLVLVDAAGGEVLAAAPAAGIEPGAGLDLRLLHGPGLLVAPPAASPLSQVPVAATVRYPWNGKLLVGLLSWETLTEVVASPALAVEGLHVYLVTADGLVVDASGHEQAAPGTGSAADAAGGVQALLKKASGAGAYQGLQGVPVFGAYRWVPGLEVGILAEQEQARFLSGGETLTALIVGATLAVALLTAAIAAVVTRRITRPIVQLTATASWMARGDLSHRVAVARRDEIGVLAGAFNRMAAELQILYANLEARVAERTAQLAAANEQARYHARQLAISAEVARVATSIRDLPALLDTVVDLIGRSFELEQTSIYILCHELPLAASRAGGGPQGICGDVEGQAASLALWQAQVTGRRSLRGVPAASVPAIVQAALAGTRGPEPDGTPSSPPASRPEMAVLLQVCGRTLGVLHVTAGSASAFGEADQVIYRSLADQIAIAIENASAYALEHETVRHLRELDRIQSRFLTNMSHALRTPLNSIIGFSRVMLKGLDGPLNEVQRNDLATIHEGGRQLLGLIDDLLELSQWDIALFAADGMVSPGEVEGGALVEGGVLGEDHLPALNEGRVDLAEIVEGVMATARALARGKPVRLSSQVPGDLPRMTTDSRLVRRLILALLANAVKFTAEGQIRLSVGTLPGAVRIGVGVVPGEGSAVAGATPWLTDAQMAIARHMVESLGGEIWAGSPSPELGGSAFAFTLPIARQGAKGDSSSNVEEAQ